MTNADKLFEELGYKKEERKYAVAFTKTTKDLIRLFGFNKIGKNIMLDVHFITMQELKAINEKCKEMGWLDD